MRLIRGAAGSGKTALVFREFKEALRNGRRDMRILVPTATLVRHFQHELARDGIVFPPAAVITLNRFALECAQPAKLVPDGLLRAIVRDCLQDVNAPEFAEVAAMEGMASTIVETIALFENAAWTPGRLALVRKLPGHARAFQKLWSAIDIAVAACGYLTRGGMFRAASAAISSATTKIQTQIWMDGFLNLSSVEKQFVGALSKSCNLTLTLTNSRGADDIRLFAMQQNAHDSLLPAAARKPEVAAVSASTMEREADEIARRILKLHGSGVPFRAIGVALREATVYQPLLQGTFERFGIPARFYFSSPLRQHPAAVFLNGLIGCVLNGWEFGAALEALHAHPSLIRSSDFDRFDFEVREVMPGAGAKALLGLAGGNLVRQISPCFDIDNWGAIQAVPAEWVRRFERVARTLYSPGLLEPPDNRHAVETARSQSAALSEWLKAVATAATFRADPQQLLSLQEFWSIAREVIDGTALRIPDDRREVVHVMNAFEARQWDVSALFVCGMTDRDFPRRNPQNLLFPDALIDSLRIPLRRTSDSDNEERELWEILKTRATDTLVLTWPEHDAGGNSVQCSRYLSDLDVPVAQAQSCRAAALFVQEGAGLPGRVSSPGLLTALAAHHQTLSLTALEDLAQCRFKFFAGRTLKLRPRPERPQERLQPKITGLILHQALEDWLNNKREGDFVEHFEAAFDRMCDEKHLPPGFRLEVERINLREIARKVSTTERWNPVSSEAEVELALNFPGGIKVTCRVDRIDRMNDTECVIVDYKSSRTARVESFVESKVKLQGPLYALAAKESLNLNTIAMMYVAVREDKRFGWGEVPGAGLELKPIPPNWMEEARERSIERLSGYLSGALQADPAEQDSCRWCDYKAACRVEQVQALVMVEGAAGV